MGLHCGYKRNHSEACRRRIIEAMDADSVDNCRVAKARCRMDHFLADTVKQGDEAAPSVEAPAGGNDSKSESVEAPELANMDVEV